MVDKEKVIKAVECRKNAHKRCFYPCERVGSCEYSAWVRHPDGEPYYPCYCDVERLCEDVLALLKEQEPRVMTLEEVKAFDWDYCYLEEERLPGKEYRAVCGDYALTCITWPCVASMRIQHGDNSYGRKWRCWTARPTKEQREAAKWDD